MSDRLTLKEYVYRRAHELGKTIKSIGDIVGSRQNLDNILKGGQRLTLPVLLKLANALEVAPLYLLRKAYSQDGMPINLDKHELELLSDSNNKLKKIEISTETKPKYDGDYSSFVGDVTIPDDTEVYANQEFEKIWAIQNTGKVVWRNRKLICTTISNEETVLISLTTGQVIPSYTLTPFENKISIPETVPGDVIKLGVRFRAPEYPCKVVSYWKMVDEDGELCFPGMKGLSCQVIVMTL